MPTYEYACQQCGHEFEQSQNMSEPALVTCPECGGKLERLIGGGVGVIVRGGGDPGGFPGCESGECGADAEGGTRCCGGSMAWPPPCMG